VAPEGVRIVGHVVEANRNVGRIASKRRLTEFDDEKGTRCNEADFRAVDSGPHGRTTGRMAAANHRRDARASSYDSDSLVGYSSYGDGRCADAMPNSALRPPAVRPPE
jgi:hypothetical protein